MENTIKIDYQGNLTKDKLRKICNNLLSKIESNNNYNIIVNNRFFMKYINNHFQFIGLI